MKLGWSLGGARVELGWSLGLAYLEFENKSRTKRVVLRVRELGWSLGEARVELGFWSLLKVSF